MKPPKRTGWESFWVGDSGRVIHLEDRKLCAPAPYRARCISSIWLFLSYSLL